MRNLRHSSGEYLAHGIQMGNAWAWIGNHLCLQSLGPFQRAQVPVPGFTWLCLQTIVGAPCCVRHSLVYLSLVVLRRYNLVWCCAKAHCGFTQPTKEWFCSISRSARRERAGQEQHPTNTPSQPEAPNPRARDNRWATMHVVYLLLKTHTNED